MATRFTERLNVQSAQVYPVVDPASLPDPGPLPDAMQQEFDFMNVGAKLRAFFSSRIRTGADPRRSSAMVSGNTFIYYNPDNLNDRISPDWYVSLNVDEEAIRAQNGYFIWAAGKPPDFALEIGSPSTSRRDLTYKRDLYANLGISEYWRFDPSGGDYYGLPLAGEKLVDGEYQSIRLEHHLSGSITGFSQVLGLYIMLDVRGELQFFDPGSDVFLKTLEEEQADHELTRDALSSERAGHDLTRDALSSEMAGHDLTRDALSSERAGHDLTRDTLESERSGHDLTRDALESEQARVRELEEEIRRLRSGNS